MICNFFFQTCFIHSRNSEASTIFQLIIFLTLAEDTPGYLFKESLYKMTRLNTKYFEHNLVLLYIICSYLSPFWCVKLTFWFDEWQQKGHFYSKLNQQIQKCDHVFKNTLRPLVFSFRVVDELVRRCGQPACLRRRRCGICRMSNWTQGFYNDNLAEY